MAIQNLQNFLQSLGQRVGTGFERMGATTDPRLSPEEQRLAGIQNLSRALRRTGATLSGDPQRMALQAQEDEALRQRRLAEDQKRRLNQFLASPEGAKYRTMGELLGPQVIPFMAQDFFKGKSERRIVEGADDYKYYVNSDGSYERVFPEVKKPQKSAVVDPLRTVTEGGKVVYNIRDSQLTPDKLNEINMSGQVVQPLGYTEKLESSVEEVFSQENQPYADKWQATGILHKNLQNYSNELAKMDEAALTGVGAGAKFATSLIQNTKGFLKLASNDTKSFYDDAVAKDSYKSLEGQDFTQRLKNVANQFGVNESQVRDLAYLFAAARGQEGRGLSDKDYENALQIVSGGVGKEGKIAVIESVYNRLGGEASSLIKDRIKTLKYLKGGSPASQHSFFDRQILQLNALQEATPFSEYINPLKLIDSQQKQTNTTNGITKKRYRLMPDGSVLEIK